MNSPNQVFLAWQCHKTRRIMPVGRLLQVGDSGYEFSYIRAARKAEDFGFRPLISFPDLNQVYRSAKLPALFSNRVMPTSRPDYPSFVSELALGTGASPIEVLERSGGRRATDELEVFGRPRLIDGKSEMHILARGVRHLPSAEPAISRLEKGEKLLLMKDEQNTHSPYARLLRTDSPAELVGFLPDYFARELEELRVDVASDVSITVEQVNPPPISVHHRLLCRVELPGDAPLFSGEEYRPIASGAAEVAA